MKTLLKKINQRFLNFLYQSLKHKFIVVYSLGKVGSSTVYNQLKMVSQWGNVFHVHFLSDEWLNVELKKGNHYESNRLAAGRVFSYLKKYPNNQKYIISLVREPVSREISNFMQNPIDYLEGDLLDYSIAELKSTFENKLNFEYTFNWFDTEFMNYTGFDVYAHSFNKERGYSIYYHDDFKILVMKLEKLDNCFSDAMSEFLGIDLKLSRNANETSSKIYSELKKSIKFSNEHLELIYSHKYVTHFYTKEEINDFITRYKN